MFKKGITDSQRSLLDTLFQQIYLNRHPYSEISGDPADCAHHFLRKPDVLRWWLPGGVSVTTSEHNDFHSKNGKELEAVIIKKRGEKWFKELHQRKFKSGKYITYQGVMNYLNGDSADYIW